MIDVLIELLHENEELKGEIAHKVGLKSFQKARDILMAIPPDQMRKDGSYVINGESVAYLLDEIVRPFLRFYGEYETSPEQPAEAS